MTITVSSGVTSNGLNISSGDRLVVLSGGVVNFSTVLSGGSATLSAGALGENLTVSSGGALIGPGLLEGYTNVAGSVGGVTVADDGFLELASGGTATGVSVTAPAAEPYSYFAIDSGATASGTVVTDAFSEVYGSAAATRITGGGEEDVYDEGVVSGDVVESGGRLVLSGGLDTGATVERGGLLVLSGGKALDATVQAGGALGVDEDVTGDFDAGPVASATSISGVTVEVGGVLDLYGATVEQGATVSLASGTVGDDLFVSAGGVVQGAGALLGQTEVAGTISGVSIGGQLELGDGASASGVTVSVDASLQIDAGATVTGVSALSGALINNLGSASGVVVASKGEIYVNSGGAETGATVQNGGEALVYSGGVATGDTIQSGGLLVLQGGGASGETVQSGGVADFQQLLTSDIVAGRVTSTTVISGVTLESGAVVSLDSATVAGGVTATLPSGASASGLDVDSGAKVVGPGVLAGFTEDLGQISGATIGGPAGFGQLFVLSGGTLSGVTIAAGGEAYLDSGAVAGALTVSKGGVLFGPGDLAGLDRIAGEVSGITLAVGGAVELVSGGRASGVVLADQAVATKTEFEIDGGAIASGTEVGGNTREVVRLGGAASGATVEGGGSEYVRPAELGRRADRLVARRRLGDNGSERRRGRHPLRRRGERARAQLRRGGGRRRQGAVCRRRDAGRNSVGLGLDRRIDQRRSAAQRRRRRVPWTGGDRGRHSRTRGVRRDRGRPRCVRRALHRLGGAADRCGRCAGGGRNIRQHHLQLQRRERGHRPQKHRLRLRRERDGERFDPGADRRRGDLQVPPRRQHRQRLPGAQRRPRWDLDRSRGRVVRPDRRRLRAAGRREDSAGLCRRAERDAVPARRRLGHGRTPLTYPNLPIRLAGGSYG
jgi:autotransporter passenger strand-loop-strand repeat protein